MSRSIDIDYRRRAPTLDPTVAQDSTSSPILRALQPSARLSRQGPERRRRAGGESHEISADAKTLTFHLRDAKYSNGEPIVAGDLVYSWKRLADPRTRGAVSYVVQGVLRAAQNCSRWPA